MPVHISPLANRATRRSSTSFVASLTKPLSKTNFVLVFLAALLLGPGIPLALLYAGKWYAAKIPASDAGPSGYRSRWTPTPTPWSATARRSTWPTPTCSGWYRGWPEVPES
ncbi:hypothetical protein BZL30_5253 [Mycobacterium kansasii]|uniref:Uncharacterized protein n=1 Tax=Mycobacterium kansasii TaxID=1768 RepID=A0A1V3X2B6_MYCKA|nr:hypothetical protein BZL30_5253 [Mycobacterium kansasii]